MEKELKFNQCQDCGCPGAKVVIKRLNYDSVEYENWVAQCPCCGRRSDPFVIARGMTKYTPLSFAIEKWNMRNRENKEGLT